MKGQINTKVRQNASARLRRYSEERSVKDELDAKRHKTREIVKRRKKK